MSGALGIAVLFVAQTTEALPQPWLAIVIRRILGDGHRHVATSCLPAEPEGIHRQVRGWHDQADIDVILTIDRERFQSGETPPGTILTSDDFDASAYSTLVLQRDFAFLAITKAQLKEAERHGQENQAGNILAGPVPRTQYTSQKMTA